MTEVMMPTCELLARTDRLERVVAAIKQFDRCRTDPDFVQAEVELKAAMRQTDGIPDPILPAQPRPA